MNNSVTATGMTIKAQTSSSLVITTGEMPTAETSSTTVALDSSVVILNPATHFGASENYTSYPTGLKYVTNPKEVDAQTGFKHGTTDLTYGSAVNTPTSKYYVDYIVLIATAGEAITGKRMTVYITNDPASESNTHKAASIDFYVQTATAADQALTASSETFKGTLNLANAAATRKVELVSTTGTIPTTSATQIQAIQVTMRVYFDGALERSSGNAYIFTNDIKTDNLSLGVSFQVED